MSVLQTLRTFFRFNASVRRRYLATILALPPSEQSKDRGASYPSLREIFGHSLDGVRLWIEFLRTGKLSEVRGLEVLKLSPEELAAATDQVEQLTAEYLGGLSVTDLDQEVVLDFGPRAGVPARFPRGDILWHVVEEELQHRGELNALLWQMDIEPPLGLREDWAAAKEFVRTRSG